MQRMENLRNANGNPGDARATAFSTPGYYSIGQAAALLGVSRVTIWRWVRAGRLPVARLGHRTTRIKREDLDGLVQEHLEQATDEPDVPQTRTLGPSTPGADGAIADGGLGPPTPRTDWHGVGSGDHLVQFYETDAFLVDGVSAFIGAALRAGDVGVVLATPAHRAALEERLTAYGLDVAAARAAGRYVTLDAAEMLARCLRDGEPDQDRFTMAIGDLLKKAARGGRRVRVFGELVALLVAKGNPAAALRLETFWNTLQQSHAFSLLCGYPLEGFDGAAPADMVGDVCAQHGRVIPAESYTGLDGTDDRLRAIAVLQQQARSLEAEAAERRRAEALVAGQAQVLELIAAGASLDAVLSALMRVIEAQSEGLVCSVLVRDLEREQFALGVAPSLPGSYIGALAGASILPPYLGPCDRAAHLGEDVVTPDIAADQCWAEAWRQLALGHGLRTCYSSPILASNNTVLGSFALYYRELRDPKPADPRLVEIAAHLAGIAIERQRAEAERAALLEREQAARAEAEAAVRLRDEFLAVASHDLKSPLTAVKGAVQLLQRTAARDGAVPPERLAATLASISTSVGQMAAQMDELLDVARLQLGQALTLDRRPTDLVALARDKVAARGQASEQHTLRLEATAAELVGDWDATRLARVLDNLLSNAIKYSPEGGEILLRLEREPADSGAGWAVLRVQDHGIGIPAADLPQIFERFHRAANAVGQMQGSGIGLSAAHQIVEQHGGIMQLESEEGRGTTVIVRLPLAPLTP